VALWVTEMVCASEMMVITELHGFVIQTLPLIFTAVEN
jgi:hypothetical protein